MELCYQAKSQDINATFIYLRNLTHEITRARRYHEEKSFWEYVNNVVEDIHLFTWRKTSLASCSDSYQRKRVLLEQELRNLEARHRKERIILRYDCPSQGDAPEKNLRTTVPHFLLP